MLINEAASLCNLTKKAVEYYAEQGLVCPAVLANGYRDFSQQDLAKLKKIALYRKLGLTIAEIRRVLAEPAELKPVLAKKTLELERSKARQDILQRLCDGENLEDLAPEINNINAKSIIIKKLLELFPSYYGKFISVNFARYLTCEIKTEEQMAAFKEIIDFFDNVPDFEIPPELREYLDNYLEEYSGAEGLARINSIIQAKNEGVANIDEFVANHRAALEAINEYRHSAEFQNSPANRLMLLMKKVCASNGYYDQFIPAMRRLSPLYDQYYTQLLKADERFSQNYPEFLE